MDPNRRELTVRSSLTNLGDSFEDNIIQPTEPTRVIHHENTENTSIDNGQNTRTIRTVKEVVGECPRIGAREAVGRQVRETKETVGDGVKAFRDLKVESIVGEDGTRMTRTSQTSSIKYSGGRSSNPTILGDFATQFTNPKILGSFSGDSLSHNIKSNFSGRMANQNILGSVSESFFNPSNESSLTRQTSNQSILEDVSKSSYSSYSPFSLTNSRSFQSFLGNQDNRTFNQSYSQNTSKQYSGLSHRFSDQGMFMNRQTPTIKEIVPPTFSYEIEDYKVKEGETAYFKGTVNGSYPFETIWYLDSTEVKPNNRIQLSMKQDCSETFLTGLIDYIISLKIINCTHDDLGKYTCYVRNEAGDASCSAYLIIEG